MPTRASITKHKDAATKRVKEATAAATKAQERLDAANKAKRAAERDLQAWETMPASDEDEQVAADAVEVPVPADGLPLDDD